MSFAAPKSTSSIKVVHVKKGRRLYGGVHTVKASGRTCYLAYRRQGEIFRSGKPSISEAIREGVACWAIDDETLLEMRAKGVPFIGVLVRETGDLYMTRLETFWDKTKVKLLNYETRGGARQRYLPLQFFKVRYGKISMKTR